MPQTQQQPLVILSDCLSAYLHVVHRYLLIIFEFEPQPEN